MKYNGNKVEIDRACLLQAGKLGEINHSILNGIFQSTENTMETL
jgi:hypothetical protein